MGHPSHRRDGPLIHSRQEASARLPRASRAVVLCLSGCLLSILLLVAPVQAGTSLQSLVTAIKEQAAHIRRHIPSVDLSSMGIEELLTQAEAPEGNRDRLLKELTKVALQLNLEAKQAVLGRVRSEHESAKASPTDEESYASRRQLILSFDFLERTAGRRPIYPKELGRPFVALVEIPSRREMQLCDGFLEFLARIPLPPTAQAGATGGTAGAGGGEDEEASETSGGSSSGGGFSPSGFDPAPSSGGHPGGPDEREDDPATVNRGWELVRWYIFGTLFALFSLYLIYVAYTAIRGGSSLLGHLRAAFRTYKQPEGDSQDPFRKGLALFGQAKYLDAIKILEPLTERALQSTQPSHYYVALAALKIRRSGLVHKHVPLLDREKFAPDELYRLAIALEENGSFDRLSLEIYLYLAGKDSSFRDAQKRAEKLQAKLEIS